MKNIAVILAGGSGTRLGDILPKQFIKIAGKKVIEHTLDVFESHGSIDEIAVVSHPNYIREMEGIALSGNYPKLKKILSGGVERYHSSLAAIEAYQDDDLNLLFHDSVRPLVNHRIISDCIAALAKYNAIDVATPTTDTIVQVNDDDEIVKIPSRSFLRNGQTPQAFKRGVIAQAYQLALKDPNFKTTDDCGVVLKYLPEEPIFVVKGEQFNMKLTYKEDIFLLDKLFQLQTIQANDRVLYDKTQLALKSKVVVVFGGHYGIGGDICALAKEQGAKVYSFSRVDGVDISNRESVEKALQQVYNNEGKIDDVINTAGVLHKQAFCTMTDEEILQGISVNYLGAIYIAKASFPYLKKSKGSLLLFASSSYTRGRAMYSLYSSTKAAIVNLSQGLNEEWASHGVRVNTINPERTKTPMRESNFGIEPVESLLSSKDVAVVSLNVLCSSLSGEVVDIKR